MKCQGGDSGALGDASIGGEACQATTRSRGNGHGGIGGPVSAVSLGRRSGSAGRPVTGIRVSALGLSSAPVARAKVAAVRGRGGGLDDARGDGGGVVSFSTPGCRGRCRRR